MQCARIGRCLLLEAWRSNRLTCLSLRVQGVSLFRLAQVERDLTILRQSLQEVKLFEKWRT